MSASTVPRKVQTTRLDSERTRKVKEMQPALKVNGLSKRLHTSPMQVEDMLTNGLFSDEYLARIRPEIDRVYEEFKSDSDTKDRGAGNV